MRDSQDGLIGCALLLLWLAASITFGGVLFDYVLDVTCGKDVPWYADAVAGLVGSAFIFPVAVACWIAVLAGAGVPFFG